jgi:hypothetical protein
MKLFWPILIVNSLILVFISFFRSEAIVVTNIEQKNQIKLLVDILILPAYAKFIFSISDEIKEKILDLLYYYMTMNISPPDLKIFQFLKIYYVNTNDHRVDQSKII